MPVPFRIPVPVNRNGAGYQLTSLPTLVSRQHSGLPQVGTRDEGLAGPSTIIVIIVLALGVLIFLGGGFLFLRRRRSGRRGNYEQAGNLEPYSGATRAQNSGNAVSETNRNSTTSGVDRTTSIRSIMTLPPYRTTATESEQVLGRAGERDGVDIIIEMPTDEQREALRDQEMEIMYQIRATRRGQNVAREDRQRRTREARDRGDSEALDVIAAERRRFRQDNTIDALREEQSHVRVRQDRAVSSVSYGDVGIARHDGTRIRANSTESERVGLLSDAASIDVSTRAPSAMSNRRVSDARAMTLDPGSPSLLPHHHRMRSVSSVLSFDNNEDIAARSGSVTPQLSGGRHTRAGSSPEIVTEADLADFGIPPPDYEDVSLDDARSGATTPIFHGPPPNYAGHTHRSASSDSGDLSSPGGEDENRPSQQIQRSSRGVGGIPQLPSLRLSGLPQIVIEPSTAHPGEGDR